MPSSPEIEQAMRSFYDSLSEKDRRRYAAIEVAKLGHGGAEYIAAVLGCDPKTIRPGQHDLGHRPDDLGDRVRQKGVDASGAETSCPIWRRTSCGW
jgi:hypothetical protein